MVQTADDNICLGTKDMAANEKKKINSRNIIKEINMIVQLGSKGAWTRMPTIRSERLLRPFT